MSNTTSGGQTWSVIGTADYVIGATATTETYCAIFNGTWSADPGWTKSGTNSSAFSLHMVVYHPSSGGTFSCTPDVALAYTETSAGTTHTITGQTPTASASVVTIARWIAIADTHTFSNLTGGWTTRGADDDLENTTGGGLVVSIADLIQTSASATGNVSIDLSPGDIVTSTSIVTFKETITTPPSFDSGPTVTAVDNNTFQVAYNADAIADTIECMALPLDASTPSAAAIDANTGSHGNATEATTGSDDTLNVDVTDSPAFPAYDVYCELEDGTSNYSSVGSQVDEFLTAPSGYTYTGRLTSIGTDSFCESFNSSVNPDIATGDILSYPSVTSPGSYALTAGLDCQASYNPGGDFSRQSALNWSVYDVSAAGYHASDIDAWWFDENVACGILFERVIKTDISMATAPNLGNIDFDDQCLHPLGDSLSSAYTTGSLPTGLSHNGSSNVTSGTVTAANENESGADLTVTATSTVTGATGTQDLTLLPVTSWTMDDYTLLTQAEAESSITILTHSTVETDITLECNPLVPVGEVISHDPGEGEEIAPFDEVSLVVSDICVGSSFRTLSCLRDTVAECEDEVDEEYNGAIFLLPIELCPSDAYGGGLVWAQTPAPKSLILAYGTITVNYCGSP